MNPVRYVIAIVALRSVCCLAQEAATLEAKSPPDNSATPETHEAPKPVISVKPTATKSNAAKPQPRTVQEATINLQTTITGNQEQPRVLYILPWQSPQTADVDFEPLDNQQKTVFSHVEREELRRELESSGELP